jgi:hypothetical protein
MTRAGRPSWSAAKAVTAIANFTAALSACGMEPWPGVPTAWSFVHAMPFSATWMV